MLSHNSSFKSLVPEDIVSLASDSWVVGVEEAGFGSLKGIDACFLMNL